MTNAEAIETLRVNYPDACYEQLREAVDAAIEALKAQDAAGDTISRQAAIDALDFEIVHMTAYCDGKNEGNPLAQYNKGLEDGKKAIEALPPAQPERKPGYWVDNGDYMYCSKCYIRLTKKTLFKISLVGKSTPNYCPGCGIDMKGK